jgi:hypothetical protein
MDNMKEYKGINFKNCGDPLTPRIIGAFHYGARLPRDYEDFLCKINGGIPDKNVFDCEWEGKGDIISDFWGASVFNTARMVGGYSGIVIPSRMIVIASATEGNLVVMSLKNPDRGKIYHLNSSFDSSINDPENVGSDLLTFVANSFDEFLSMLYPESEIDISAYEKDCPKVK